jgi:hypothetical protein
MRIGSHIHMRREEKRKEKKRRGEKRRENKIREKIHHNLGDGAKAIPWP